MPLDSLAPFSGIAASLAMGDRKRRRWQHDLWNLEVGGLKTALSAASATPPWGLGLRRFTHVTCATDYIGRVTERNEFHWVHYDLDGPAHLDPTYTGTGIYYRSIY